MKNFFITYNKADVDWAKWIVWQLEDVGCTTVAQFKDFAKGVNFVLNMETALKECERVIAVMSPNWVVSEWTAADWTAAFTLDPSGAKGLLLPIRVRTVQPPVLLSSRPYIDLIDLDELKATAEIRQGIQARGAPAGVALSEETRWQPKPPFPFRRVDVWLQYCDADALRAEGFATGLESKGLDVWRDQWKVSGGAPNQQMPPPAILQAQCWAICASGDTPSVWVHQQLDLAIARQKAGSAKYVNPILLPGAPPDLRDDFPSIGVWAGRNDAVRVLYAAAKGLKLEPEEEDDPDTRLLRKINFWHKDGLLTDDDLKMARTEFLREVIGRRK